MDLNAVGVDFGEEDEMGGFDYHKLTPDQLKRMYTMYKLVTLGLTRQLHMES